MSPAYERIWGCSTDRLYENPQSFLDAVHEEDKPQLMEAIGRRSSGEITEATAMEYRIVRPDGEVRWIRSRQSSITRDNGSVSRMLGVAEDITAHKQAEQALSASENRERAILDSALDGIITINHEGRIVELNPAAERIFGIAPRDAVGRTLAEVIVPPHLRENHRQGFERYLASGQSTILDRRVELTACRADGSVFPVELTVTRIATDGPPMFTGHLRDITERKRAEHDVRIRDQAIATSVMPAAFGDSNHLITHVNQAFLDLFRVPSREHVVAQPNTAVFHTRPTPITEINAALAQDGSWVGEVTCDRFDGTPIEVLTSASMIFDDADQPAGCLVTFVDVTDRNRIRQQREQLIAELEQKNTELERFTYTVSHDLKSPLVTISGFLGMLRKDLEKQNDEAIADDMAEIAGGVEQMRDLLEQLLDLSRVGRVMHPSEDVRLNELMTEVVESVGGAITQRNAHIAVGELISVRCDRVRMREVLQNLLENAIKFCDEEPHIEVGVRNSDCEPVVFVRDNGIGLDPNYSEKVFGLFEQLDASREGTGIGLALAKRIIESHGGRIWVESDGVGHGSTFCFTVKEHNER